MTLTYRTVAVGFAAMAVGLVAMAVACNPSRPTDRLNTRVEPTGTNVLSVLAVLESKQDMAACRLALQQLDGNDRAVAERGDLSASDREELSRSFRLTEAEVAETGQKTFVPADAAYLEECLLVRAAVRTLKVDALPPLERGRRSFDWLCRIVYIDDRVPWPAPPWYTLQWGAGIPLSRAYAILAVWHQVGLDGCLIGPAELESKVSYDGDPASPDRALATYAPVRAVGLRVGGDVFLFDHVAGRAVPTVDGKGVATLAQARANPALVTGLGRADESKAWECFLVPPVPSFAPRMEWLARYNPGKSGVVLAVNGRELLDRWRTEARGMPVRVWAPPADPFGPSRVLLRYAGEKETKVSRVAIRDSHRVLMVPMEAFPKTNLDGIALVHIRQSFARPFEELRYAEHSPRDLMLRGYSNEATAALASIKEQVDTARVRAADPVRLRKDFDQWSEEFQRRTADLIRSGDNSEEASRKFDEFRSNRQNLDIERAFVYGFAARHLWAEVTYLNAQCMQERAERTQAEEGPAAAAQYWNVARDWWKWHVEASAEAGNLSQARLKHAQNMLARVEQSLATPK